MSNDDATYFAGRAAKQLHMAEISSDSSARDAHRQMAEMYAAKSAEHRQLEQLPSIASA